MTHYDIADLWKKVEGGGGKEERGRGEDPESGTDGETPSYVASGTEKG